jgi:hypothetical protein
MGPDCAASSSTFGHGSSPKAVRKSTVRKYAPLATLLPKTWAKTTFRRAANFDCQPPPAGEPPGHERLHVALARREFGTALGTEQWPLLISPGTSIVVNPRPGNRLTCCLRSCGPLFEQGGDGLCRVLIVLD